MNSLPVLIRRRPAQTVAALIDLVFLKADRGGILRCSADLAIRW
jgi:hypothetical protein